MGATSGRVLVFLFGVAFTGWSWYTALTEGYFYKLAAVVSGLAVFGLGTVFFPMDSKELLAKYGVDRPKAFVHLALE